LRSIFTPKERHCIQGEAMIVYTTYIEIDKALPPFTLQNAYFHHFNSEDHNLLIEKELDD
jgi:hypothetical protein